MSNNIEGKVVVITGASSGLGEVTALLLCAQGAGIVLVHRLISGRHTVGFKRVWMQGASEERIRCDT